MAVACIPPEDFGQLAGRAPEDPARRHLAACARCQARYLSYRSFMDEGDAPEGAQLEDARTRLEALTRRELALPRAAPSPARVTRGIFTPRRLLFVLAPAACIALLLAYRGLGPGARDEVRPVVLRGSGDRMFAIETPAVLADGSVALRWRAVLGASGYRVRLYDAGLRLLHESAVVPDTFLVLPAVALPRPDPASTLLWRAVAHAGSAELAESAVGTIPSR